jgi:hypothetical protein
MLWRLIWVVAYLNTCGGSGTGVFSFNSSTCGNLGLISIVTTRVSASRICARLLEVEWIWIPVTTSNIIIIISNWSTFEPTWWIWNSKCKTSAICYGILAILSTLLDCGNFRRDRSSLKVIDPQCCRPDCSICCHQIHPIAITSILAGVTPVPQWQHWFGTRV